MRFDVLTLFPELFEPHLRLGVTRRAFQEEALQVRLWPLRDFTDDPHRRVDDRPFGGGPGMVMLAQPLQRALQAACAQRRESRPQVILFSPAGRRLDQALVEDMARGPGAVLVCGRYEGVDQRFIDAHVSLELSVGDFVLSGGELPALSLLDAVARLVPGVMAQASHQNDSFSDGLLEGPAYSRPEQLPQGEAVPQVLLSGHHAQIARWRRERSLELTARRRPELIEAARRRGRLTGEDERFLAGLAGSAAI